MAVNQDKLFAPLSLSLIPPYSPFLVHVSSFPFLLSIHPISLIRLPAQKKCEKEKRRGVELTSKGGGKISHCARPSLVLSSIPWGVKTVCGTSSGNVLSAFRTKDLLTDSLFEDRTFSPQKNDCIHASDIHYRNPCRES